MTPEERSRRLRQLAIIAGLAIVLVVGVIVATQGGSDGDGGPADDTAEVEELFAGIPQEGVALGEPDAPLTMADYSDMQCPFCREFALDALPAVIDDYVRAGDLRIEFRPVSILGPESEAAAELVAAASLQNRLWELTEVFYRNQGTENTGYVTDDFLTDIAEATPGLDAGAAMADRSSPEAQAVLEEATTEFDQNGFDSTPSFAIGETGGRLRPAAVAGLDPTSFAELIDQALARVEGG